MTTICKVNYKKGESAGMNEALGEAVVVIDADLQEKLNIH